MRSYFIDEISHSQMETVTDFFKENSVVSKLDNLFWIYIPDDLLESTQFQHRQCYPYAFAVELGKDWIKFEFLIRSLKNMQCECQDYGTQQQRDYIIKYAHSLIEKLHIKT